MPTYEYRCPNGHNFEQFHRISDAPSTVECPTCSAVAERAISGGAGLVFKGSGFYLTDYGKNAHRTSGPANKAPSSSAESSSGSSGGNGASGGGESSSKPAPAKSEGSSGSSSGGSSSKASE
jgi:putative FmdB family regulatory protein